MLEDECSSVAAALEYGWMEVDQGWRPARLSKPLGAGSARPGGFDSHAPPPIRLVTMPPLRQEQLSDFLKRGCRPRSDWRLGVELEQFVVDSNGLPVQYSGAGGVSELLHFLLREH